MTNKGSEQAISVTTNLQRAFEKAVRDIYEAGLNGNVPRYRRPIVQRVGAGATELSLSSEKRAVSDAARALAQLWNVSQKLGR